jgi:integral membrane protein
LTSSLTISRVTPRSFYRVVAIAEAVTWTLLIAGLLLKYVFDAGDLGVRVGGSIHGFVFLVYAATAVLVGVNQRWRIGLIAFGVLTAIVPYATIPFDRWLERNGKLDGDWRTTATDDPRDHTWISRLLRWFLNHPVVLGVLLVVGIVVVFTVLLILGPPGGRS